MVPKYVNENTSEVGMLLLAKIQSPVANCHHKSGSLMAFKLSTIPTKNKSIFPNKANGFIHLLSFEFSMAVDITELDFIFNVFINLQCKKFIELPHQ